LSSLQNEYAKEDVIYQQKVKDLCSKYLHVRKTRGDGNCFFRAFTFAYLESLITDKEEYDRFRKILTQSKEDLVKLGYSQFTIEDFYDTFMEVFNKVGEGASIESLRDIFNDQNYSDYLIVYMRLITSGHLQKESDFYANFVEGNRTIKEFCQQEVEPMFKESDHIHVIALTSAVGVCARIQYMDRGDGGLVNAHDFPDGGQPRIHLLYRPGHYDILYV